MGLHDILGKVRYGDITLPRLARIPDDHVLVEDYHPVPFQAGRHYFTVRVNSMSLLHNRQWLATWQPMLVAVTEFRYEGREVSVPFVIGPAMLRQSANADIPFATVFAATQVAGPHPYIGDRVAVTVLLYRVKYEDYVKQVLGVVEKLAGAFDYASMLAPYLTLVNAVIDGIDAILGDKDTVPVLGHRIECNPNAGDMFRSGYYAVLGEQVLDPASLWVHPDHVLAVGSSATANALVRDDLVLYSVTGADTRNDVATLPWFDPLWKRVFRAANTPDDDGKQAAKAHLGILYEQLSESPDIALAEVDSIYEKYESLARSTHVVALGRRGWGPANLAESGDDLQRDFLNILNGEWR